jgi:competence protein ComEA
VDRGAAGCRRALAVHSGPESRTIPDEWRPDARRRTERRDHDATGRTARAFSIETEETMMKKLLTLLACGMLSLAVAQFAFAAGEKTSPKAAPAAAKKADAKAAPGAEKKSEEKLDLNSADPKELMKLDGIGDQRASAIVKGRPYKRKDELVRKEIIPQAVYDKIKDRIIAKQK